MKYIQQTLDK